jgi:hypothetical protein
MMWSTTRPAATTRHDPPLPPRRWRGNSAFPRIGSLRASSRPVTVIRRKPPISASLPTSTSPSWPPRRRSMTDIAARSELRTDSPATRTIASAARSSCERFSSGHICFTRNATEQWPRKQPGRISVANLRNSIRAPPRPEKSRIRWIQIGVRVVPPFSGGTRYTLPVRAITIQPPSGAGTCRGPAASSPALRVE